MAMPTQDTQLIAWGLNFDTKVTLAPTTYNLTAAQATSFHTAYQAFVTAFNAVATAREAGSRSKSLTDTKNFAKLSLLGLGRQLYGFVQNSGSVSNANKVDIGVTPKNTTPSPVPVPDKTPGIAILATVGNTVKLRIFNPADVATRGKPPGVAGISVFSSVSATAPTTESAWTFEGITGETKIDITFPDTTPAGSKVWFTAFYFNNRKQNGPAATPVGINIPGNAAMAA